MDSTITDMPLDIAYTPEASPESIPELQAYLRNITVDLFSTLFNAPLHGVARTVAIQNRPSLVLPCPRKAEGEEEQKGMCRRFKRVITNAFLREHPLGEQWRMPGGENALHHSAPLKFVCGNNVMGGYAATISLRFPPYYLPDPLHPRDASRGDITVIFDIEPLRTRFGNP